MIRRLIQQFRAWDLDRRISACADEADDMAEVIAFAHAKRADAQSRMAELIRQRAEAGVAP